MPAPPLPLPIRTVTSSSPPDIDAIKAVDPSTFTSYQTGGLLRATNTNVTETTKTKRWTCSATPIFTWGDVDTGGIGVEITNSDSVWAGFYFYYNNCDDVPYKYVWIDAGQTVFVSLPSDFQGRATRGVDAYNLDGQPQLLASWFEFSFDSAGIWGDISLIRGCDGAVFMWATDGSAAWKGFTQDILDGAPSGAYATKSDGQSVIMNTENLDGSINTIPRDWDLNQVGAEYVYVDDEHGSPVILSTNGRFGTWWPAGRP
ncbi:hypothetical protein BX600DRAFT_480677 [Xylariales sp. PMI_506]|nr:hypothetical protein BX600DRAFT_480677 [Xylariales sp. PMI_506]